MPNNLLIWPNLQATELMILLHERMGGTWQGDLSVRRPSKLYIPMFGPTCRVMLKFDGPKIVAIEPGEAFDTTHWEQISSEIENSVLRGPTRVGREYSFSSRRVTGSWRGRHSGIQILPPPNNAPHPTIQPADYPFILEFPLMNTSIDQLTNHRRIRKHRDLTLLLNILLFGGAKLMGLRPPHVWVLDLDDLGRNSDWVAQGFRAPLGSAIIDSLSAPAADQLEEVEPEQYDEVVVSDELRVPSDLDQSICLYGHFRVWTERSLTAPHSGLVRRRVCGISRCRHHSRSCFRNRVHDHREQSSRGPMPCLWQPHRVRADETVQKLLGGIRPRRFAR